jgi:hypothetical protein
MSLGLRERQGAVAIDATPRARAAALPQNRLFASKVWRPPQKSLWGSLVTTTTIARRFQQNSR